jgi:DNA-binding protein HU-beta
MEKKNDNMVRQTDLVSMAAERCSISKEDLGRALSAFLASISKSVDDGKTVVLSGFGRFGKRHVAEHTAVLPDKRTVTVPEHDLVKFQPSSSFATYHLK